MAIKRKKMKILVTGGAGFIGSHLCETLLERDNQVVVLDDLSTGSYANLAMIQDKITFFNCKVENYDFGVLKNIDAVVHLAAQASVPLSISNFYESSKTNLLSSLKVLDFCTKHNIPLVYASSSAVYGGLPYGDDEVNTSDLISPYAADKYALELYSKVLSVTSNLSSVGLRFFNVYGPRQDPSSPYSGVISIFAERLSAHQDVTVNGGNQTRDFVYVTDVAHAITEAINLALSEKMCEFVNVLTGRSVSIDWLADILIETTKSSSKKTYKEMSAGDPLESNGAVAKLSHVLGIASSDMVPLEEGLALTLNYLKDGVIALE
jgi:UDP-glucose 4-epimerase